MQGTQESTLSSPLPAKAFVALKAHRSERVAAIVAQRPPRRELAALDTTRWPIVVGTFNGNNLEELLDGVTACHLRGHFALIIDLRAAPPLTAHQRHTIAAARLADQERFPGVRIASASVADTPMQDRQVLALGWMADVAYPHQSFAKLEYALAWCDVQLKVAA